MTPIQVADLLAEQYKASDVFDIIDVGRTTGVYYSIKSVPEGTLICLRGSVALEDWLRDAEALANPLSHSVLGPIHSGFMKGVPEAWAQIKSRTKGPYLVAGHSLGAARAALMSALMIQGGVVPLATYGFGEPHPGTMKLRMMLSKIPMQAVYRTVAGTTVDHVTQVPIPSILVSWTSSAPFIDLKALPLGQGPMSLHHIEVYRSALGA